MRDLKKKKSSPIEKRLKSNHHRSTSLNVQSSSKNSSADPDKECTCSIDESIVEEEVIESQKYYSSSTKSNEKVFNYKSGQTKKHSVHTVAKHSNGENTPKTIHTTTHKRS